ncbi:MAG TPA: imidazole glycerol phosphate synthase cyclase subunit [Planctomycetota bacterium]
MLKVRLIPVLLLQNGLLVRSERFKEHQIIGNPIQEVRRFNEWNVDELVYLDISRDGDLDLRREDHKVKGFDDPLTIIEEVSKTCFMPLTWGGRIRSVEDMRERFLRGADKVAINTAAVRTPALIEAGARMFGSQAIVVNIDVLKRPDGRREVFIDGGRTATGLDPVAWARDVEKLGAGEILLQSMDRDGTAEGYDLDLIRAVAPACRIPVVALGGVGRYEDYAEGVKAGASAVAAANLWHFKEMADRGGKRALAKAGVAVRA